MTCKFHIWGSGWSLEILHLRSEEEIERCCGFGLRVPVEKRKELGTAAEKKGLDLHSQFSCFTPMISYMLTRGILTHSGGSVNHQIKAAWGLVFSAHTPLWLQCVFQCAYYHFVISVHIKTTQVHFLRSGWEKSLKHSGKRGTSKKEWCHLREWWVK